MLALYISLGVAGGLILIALFVWFNNSCLQTTRYAVKLNTSGKAKIVHLSDLHGKSFSRGNSRLIKKVAAEEPDFIVITGDIVHKYRPKDVKNALELVSALCAVAPVLYSSGNHEMRSKRYRFLKKDLAEAGATVLDNDRAEICGLTVVGLNCAYLKNGDIKKVCPDPENKIFLAHMPHYLDRYEKAVCGLVLSGHAHGGQWRIPFTGRGLYAPGQGVFPKLTQGLHEKGGTKIIISRGLGNSECPLRLFNRPEIVVISVNE